MIAAETTNPESIFFFKENYFIWPGEGEYTWRLFRDAEGFTKLSPLVLVEWVNE